MKDGKKISDALWCDCETDDERVHFIQSGRACATDIMAQAIQHEVAMAFDFRFKILNKYSKQPASPGYRDLEIQ